MAFIHPERTLFMRLILLAFLAISITACNKKLEVEQPPPTQPVTTYECSPELSGDKSKYFQTAQKLGVDFSKLAKLPFSAGLENEVNRVVKETFQTVPESAVRCLIVSKLQACALRAGNFELQLRMQDSVDKACALPGSSTTPVTGVDVARSKSYTDIWACIPPAQRGGVVDFENTEPKYANLCGGLLFWVAEPDGQALSCAETLLKAGADPNCTSYLGRPATGFLDGPPLHHAITQRRWDMADMLLAHGANPNRRSLWGQYTALTLAEGYRAPEELLAKMKVIGLTQKNEMTRHDY
jgi:hypothetical protein